MNSNTQSRSVRLRRWRNRSVVFLLTGTGLFFCLVLLPAMSWAPVAPDWLPEGLKWWAYDSRLWIGRPALTAGSLTLAVQGETEVEWIPAGEPVMFASDGLQLRGLLYAGESAEEGPQPGILLLHGSSPQGGRLGFYRLLARELAAQGYVVLVYDQRGYGLSDDPPDIQDAASFDFVRDVQPALDFLAGLPAVDDTQLYLIGHSFGGDVALSALARGAADVEKGIIIGPGRGFLERGGAPDRDEFDYFRRREQRYMRLRELIPPDTFIAYRTGIVMENNISALKNGVDIPMLWLDGMLEAPFVRQFLETNVAQLGPEHQYQSIPDSDHYVNVANLGALVVFDEAVFTDFVNEITGFVEDD